MIRSKVSGTIGFLMATLLVCAAGAVAAPDPPAGPVSVDEAVRIALRQNYTYRQAEAGVAVAEGANTDALAGLLPGLGADYTYNRNKSTTTLFDFPIRQQIDNQGNVVGVDRYSDVDLNNEAALGTLGLSAREDLSLGRWYNHKAAQADLSSARFDLQAAAQDLAYTVRQQYYLVLRAQDLLIVQQEDLRLANDEERRINSMFELGSVAKADVLKAKVRVAEAELVLIQQKNAVAVESARLATLLGYSPDTRLTLEGGLDAQPAAVDSAQAVEEAASRPDLASARAQLDGAGHRAQGANWSWFPGLFATFGWNTTSGWSQSDQFRSVPDPNATDVLILFPTPEKSDVQRDGWDVRVGASVNLDLFFNRGSAKQARAIELRTEYQLEGLELAAQQEMEEAILNYRAFVAAIGSAESAMESAEEDLRLSQERYQQGLGTVLELLEAQVNLTRARNAVVNAITGLKISEAAIDKARGAPLP